MNIKKTYNDNIIITRSNASEWEPKLKDTEEIAGILNLGAGAICILSDIKRIKEIVLDEDSVLIVPRLQEIDSLRQLYHSTCNAPVLNWVWHLELTDKCTLTAPTLQGVKFLQMSYDAKFTASKLVNAEYVYLAERAELRAPLIKQIKCLLDMRDQSVCDMPRLKEVEELYMECTTTLNAPRLVIKSALDIRAKPFLRRMGRK